MHVEYDAGGQRFKIQKEPYGPVAIVNFSQTFDAFEVIEDEELVVYRSGFILGRFDGDGRQTY
jgi:hypothetical protein